MISIISFIIFFCAFSLNKAFLADISQNRVYIKFNKSSIILCIIRNIHEAHEAFHFICDQLQKLLHALGLCSFQGNIKKATTFVVIFFTWRPGQESTGDLYPFPCRPLRSDGMLPGHPRAPCLKMPCIFSWIAPSRVHRAHLYKRPRLMS